MVEKLNLSRRSVLKIIYCIYILSINELMIYYNTHAVSGRRLAALVAPDGVVDGQSGTHRPALHGGREGRQ